MPITAICSSCGMRFQAPQAFVGKRVKCKGCGTVFQVKGNDGGALDPGDTDLDALAAVESSAASVQSPEGSQRGRISAKNEKRLEANPLADDIPFVAPTSDSGRPNYLYFRYPGARQIDQWLPLGLLLIGFILLAGMSSGQDTKGVMWIALLRFVIPVLCFSALIVPMAMAGLRKAAGELRYRMPPNPKLRTFAIYTPAFVLATGLWLTGDGSLTALILGAVVGLILSSAALWLLYRLREPELAVSVGYGAGGFLAGLLFSCGLVLGLNWLTMLILVQAKATPKVPASPFGPGLAWIAPPPPVDEIAQKPKPIVPATPTVSGVPGTLTLKSASPVVSDVSLDKTDPAAVTGSMTIIAPLGDVPAVAMVHEAPNKSVSIDAWNTTTWQQIGSSLKLPSSLGQFALSPDGQRIAYIDRFPKLSAKIWSFTSESIVKRVDLNPLNGEPKLLGFCDGNSLIVRWITPSASSADATAKAQPWTIEVLDIENQKQVTTFTTPPIEPGPAPMAFCVATRTMAVATKVSSTPALMQFSLDGRAAPLTIPITEIDPSVSVAPTGLAYTTDGKRLAVLFEYGGGAVIPVFDSTTGVESRDLEFPSWPLAGVESAGYTGNALAWAQGYDAILVYGQSILDVAHNKSVATLGIPGVNSQRVISPTRFDFVVDLGGSKRIATVTLDAEKLGSLLPLTATQPATMPTNSSVTGGPISGSPITGTPGQAPSLADLMATSHPPRALAPASSPVAPSPAKASAPGATHVGVFDN